MIIQRIMPVLSLVEGRTHRGRRGNDPEQQQLKDTVHKFAVEEMIPVAAKYDKEQEFPDDVCRKAWELGILNPLVPTE